MEPKQEVWVLKRPDGIFVPPMDDDDTNGFMAWLTEEEARQGMAHLMKSHDFSDEPLEVVRIA